MHDQRGTGHGAGPGAEEIVASYPPLRVEDVRAATAYAAELAREPIVEVG